MRIAQGDFRRQFHLFQQRHSSGFRFFIGNLGKVAQRLTDDIANPHLGIKGRRRVLKNHLDMLGHCPAFFTGKARDILALKIDFAAVCRMQAHNRADKSGLAAAGLTDQPQRFATVELQAHILTGGKLRAVTFGKFLADFICGQQNFLIRHSVCLQSPAQPAKGSGCNLPADVQ